jgi:hypothetical protein
MLKLKDELQHHLFLGQTIKYMLIVSVIIGWKQMS